MKRFRIVYWFSTSIMSERYTSAADETEARQKFAELCDKPVVSIEEIRV